MRFCAPNPINGQFHHAQITGGAFQGFIPRDYCHGTETSREIICFPPRSVQGRPPGAPGLTRTIPGLPELLVYELHLLQAALELLDAVKQGQGRRREATGGRLGDGVPAPSYPAQPQNQTQTSKTFPGVLVEPLCKPFVFVRLLPVLHQLGQNAIQCPLEVVDAVGALGKLLHDLQVGKGGGGRLLPAPPAPMGAPSPCLAAHPLQPALHHRQVLQSRQPAASGKSLVPEDKEPSSVFRGGNG